MNDLNPQRNFIPTVIPIPRYRYTPLAKSYIIFQRLSRLFPPEEALVRGTIFPELYIPYTGKKHEKGYKKGYEKEYEMDYKKDYKKEGY